jgi:hypothetical protein
MPNLEASLEVRLTAAFKPTPLDADKDADIYVELDAVRGDGSIVTRLVKGITNSPGSPRCQLFTGHIGSGKSSELNRVRSELRKAGVFAVVVKVERDADLNNVDAPEVLLAIVRQLVDALEESDLGIRLRPTLLRARLEWLADQLRKEPDLQGLEFGTDLVKLNLALRDSPSTRAKVRRLLEPDTPSWINAANDVIQSARVELKAKGFADLAILVDDLDKMAIRGEAGGEPRDRYLFIDRWNVLAGLKCHTVYNVPLSLERSIDGQRLAQLYGQSSVPVVPMVKLRDQGTAKRFPPGFKAMRELVQRRLDRASATEKQVFSPGIVDRLIASSGGQPRVLCTLITGAIDLAPLPISQATADRVERDVRRSFEHQLLEEHWSIIESVRKTGRLPRSAGNDRLIAELLHNRVILAYTNGGEWYAPNPLLPEPVRTRRAARA